MINYSHWRSSRIQKEVLISFFAFSLCWTTNAQVDTKSVILNSYLNDLKVYDSIIVKIIDIKNDILIGLNEKEKQTYEEVFLYCPDSVRSLEEVDSLFLPIDKDMNELDSLKEEMGNAYKYRFNIRRYYGVKLIDETSKNIVDSSLSFKKLDFLRLQPGDKVGEIGAGYGSLVYLLGLVHKDVKIYINEISAWKLESLKRRFKNRFSSKDYSKFIFIQGSAESTEMEDKNLDLIVLENTFHHLTNKDSLLESIKMSIHPIHGRLILIEEFKSNSFPSGRCQSLLSEPEIKEKLCNYGFSLLREKRLDNYKTALEYVVSSSTKCKP